MSNFRHSVLPGHPNFKSLKKFQGDNEGSEYQGEDDNQIFGIQMPYWLKTSIQILDPTGVSSYGDVGRSWKSFYNNPSWGGLGSSLLETASAAPIIGKIGKGVKLATEAEKLSKLGKLTRKVEKVGEKLAKNKFAKYPVNYVVKPGFNTVFRPIEKYVEPVVQKLDPTGITRFVKAAATKAVEKSPKLIQHGARFGTMSNRYRRWDKATDLLLRRQDTGNNYMVEDEDFELPQNAYGGSLKNNFLNTLNNNNMYFYATGGIPNNPGFNALPGYVQKKIIDNMRYGGLKRFQGDQEGSEYQGDNMDYTPYDDNQTYYYPQDMMDQYDEQQILPGAVFENTDMNSQPAAYTAPSMPTPSITRPNKSGYTGYSIVDYLNKLGAPSDYATRKEIAKTIGIRGYRGTADQNLQMLSSIMNNPQILGLVSTKSSSKKSSSKKSQEEPETQFTYEEIQSFVNQEDARNPYVSAPPTPEVPQNGSSSYPGDSNNPYLKYLPYLGAAAGAGGLGYGAYKYFNKAGKAASSGIPMGAPTQRLGLPSSEMAKAAAFQNNVRTGKQVISEIRNKGFYTADDLRVLNKTGYKNIQKLISDFPKGTPEQVAKFAKTAAKASKSGGRIAEAFRAGLLAAKEAPLFKFFSRFREDGGENDYSGTWSGNTYYDMGGGYPYGGMVGPYMMGQSGYDLPMYGMGSNYYNNQEMDVTPEEMEMLRQQGYDFDVIG